MASSISVTSAPASHSVLLASPSPTPFDRRLSKILQHGIEVFCEKGYEGASMRDLSRASGMSLAGLYYYFESKEKLLYLIQKHTFTTIVERLQERLNGAKESEDGIRLFILNHLDYFLAHQKAMKVLSHEDDVLTGSYAEEIAAIKREYYHICLELLNKYKRERHLEFSSRIAVLSLFGMVNWIYTWYNPRVDAGSKELAREMAENFLKGISGRNAINARRSRLPSPKRKAVTSN